MTNDRLELLLAACFVLVYLIDSLRLLGHRQALVERIAEGRWRISFGAVRFELLGKRPALPNPLRPDRASRVVDWSIGTAKADAAAKIGSPAAGRLLGALCLVLLVIVVVLAPVLLVAGEGIWFAAAIAAGYLVAIAAATWLVMRAAEFGLARSTAVGIGVIGVICLPCAPNLLRVAGAGPKMSVPLPAFGDASAGAAERRGFRTRFAAALRQELWQGTGDTRQDALIQAILTDCEGRS
jgi:hypothetical protein